MFLILLLFLNISFNLVPPQENSSDSLSLEPKDAEQDTLVQNELVHEELFLQKVFIIGNKQTQEQIILRELDLKPEIFVKSVDLLHLIEKDKNKIFNTGLFTSVEISPIYLSPEIINLVISVKERWYTFPVPVFKLADRNFNDWWENQNRDLKRVDYGLRFYKYNMRGRNEKFKATAQFGFNKTFDLQYSIPYINKAQKNGLAVYGNYTENNSIAYKTTNHKLVFLNTNHIIRESYRAGITFSHRQSFFSYHYLSFSFNKKIVNDTIPILNPEYFLNARNEQKYFFLSYRFRRDLRNISAYPLTGYLVNFEIEKLGLFSSDDINQFGVYANYSRYLDLGKNYYLSSRISGNLTGPQVQPYLNFRGMGYHQDFIRGYELYVIEGQSYFLNKTTFKKRLIAGTARMKSLIPLEQFQTIPFAIYLKSFFDSGIVNNNTYYPENTSLTNKFLFGGGMGLDIVTYYDFVIRFEYSMNSIKERGFFINVKAEF